MCLHLAHGIEHHADNDQQARAAEKLRCDHRHVESLAQKAWQHRYQRQKDRAGKRESCHGEIEKIRSRFPGPYAGNVTTVFLQVVRDLRRLKLRGNPKIAEEENHCPESDIMGPTGGERACDLRGCGTVSKSVLDNRRREEKQRPGKDDWHHAGVIYFQRHVLRLSTVHFATDHALGILHGDLAHALCDRDHRRDDYDQQQHQQHQDHWIHLARPGLRRGHKGLPRLCQCSGQTRDNANSDDKRDSVANAALGDLIAQPHQ